MIVQRLSYATRKTNVKQQQYGYCKDLVISRHMVRYILTRVISVKSSKNLEKTQVTMVKVPARMALSMGHGMLNTFVFV